MLACLLLLGGIESKAGSFTFSPISAAVGSKVALQGSNFSPVPENNIVYFGAVRATGVTAASTGLLVTVPPGATYAPITVTVHGLTDYSEHPFLPTFVGDGSGINASSFAPPLVLPAGNNPYLAVIADLDGDGKPDLIVANIRDDTISIYRNISTKGPLSAASFAPPVNLRTTPSSYAARGLAAADLEGNGKLDIVWVNCAKNQVSVYRNTCTPGRIRAESFATRVDFPTGAMPVAVAVRDLDGDGRPDLVTANSGDGTISILRNTGATATLTARSFAPRMDIFTGRGCYSVAAGDLDGDGKPDLVTANSQSGTVSLLRNLSLPGHIAFARPANLATVDGPFHVSIGDLDGDGKMDLAVSCYLSQTLSVFRNRSTPGNLFANTFAPRIDYALGGRGHTSAIADLDGDGKPDLAVVTELDSLFSVFRNVSTPGSFTSSSLAARVDFAAGYNAWGVAVGDLDGDGRPDVVFCNQYDSTIFIYQNIVPFGATTGPPEITQDPMSQAVNAGTKATFSASAVGSPSTIQWYFGTKAVAGPDGKASPLIVTADNETAGRYKAVFRNAYGTAVSAVAVLTVIDPPLITKSPASTTNMAGKTVAFKVTASGTLPLDYYWRKNGAGLTDGGNVSGASTSDLKLDKISLADMAGYDVVVSNAAGSVTSLVANLTVLSRPSILVQPAGVSDYAGTTATFTVTAIGTGTLSYQWERNKATVLDGGNISGSRTATLTLTNLTTNDAGTYTVLVTDSFGSTPSASAVLTIIPPPAIPVIVSFNPGLAAVGSSVTISGINFSPVPSSNIVYFGAVQATIVTAGANSLLVTVPPGATYAPITVTVDGLTAWSGHPFLPTFLGNGLGISSSSFASRLDLPAGKNPYRVIIADLDGDGKPDLIVANISDNSISLYRNLSTNGPLSAASFASPVNLPTPVGINAPRGLAAADLDGDGKLDIIWVGDGTNVVSIYQNTCTPGVISAASFSNRVDFVTGAGPNDVVVADIDGDGKPDLLVANSGDGTVSIFRNTSVPGSLTSGSFAPKVDFATGSACYSVSAGDLDGDGKPDVVTPNAGNNTVSVLRNLSSPGSIAFAPAVNLTAPNTPFQVTIGDLDGDGKPDLAVSCYLSQTLSVFRNLGTPGSLTTNSFAPGIAYGLGGRGHASAIGDLDGDGKPDLAVVTELGSLLSIFRNAATPGSFTNSSLAPRVNFSTGQNAWGVSVGDLDGDGRPDVVFCNEYDNTISIYQNSVPFGVAPALVARLSNPGADAGVVAALASRQAEEMSVNTISSASLDSSVAVGTGLLAISRSGVNIILSWPVSAGADDVQMATSLGGSWTVVNGVPVTNGPTVFLTLPAPSTTTFFRLSQPAR